MKEQTNSTGYGNMLKFQIVKLQGEKRLKCEPVVLELLCARR
jgi:hypothetical protein